VSALAGDFSHGRRGLGVRFSGTTINARYATGIGLGTIIKYPHAQRRNFQNFLRRTTSGCLATVQIKPVSPLTHAAFLCLLYLSDDAASPFLPTHLAPGVRRCSAFALRLGVAFKLFGLTPSSCVANNETLQQASAHPCSSGENLIVEVALIPPPCPSSGCVFIQT
jgi:hypothetical protein